MHARSRSGDEAQRKGPLWMGGYHHPRDNGRLVVLRLLLCAVLLCLILPASRQNEWAGGGGAQHIIRHLSVHRAPLHGPPLHHVMPDSTHVVRSIATHSRLSILVLHISRGEIVGLQGARGGGVRRGARPGGSDLISAHYWLAGRLTLTDVSDVQSQCDSQPWPCVSGAEWGQTCSSESAKRGQPRSHHHCTYVGWCTPGWQGVGT
eukprot:1185379-Prorocentrum_minimum.AAC.3